MTPHPPATPACRTTFATVLAAAAVGLAGTCAAAEFDMAGNIDSVAEHRIEALAEGRMVILASMQQTLGLAQPNHPMQAARGPCGGSMWLDAGAVTGAGHCSFVDAGDDRFVIAWQVTRFNEQGGPAGTWELVGGTGKYERAKAAGNYNDVPAETAGHSIVHLEGSLSLPD